MRRPSLKDRQESLERRRSDHHQVAVTLWNRLSLWLALANGAGLATVVSNVLGPAGVSPHLPMLLPSAWAFALGLISAGLFTHAHQRAASAVRAIYDASFNDGTPTDEQWATYHRRMDDARGLDRCSGAAFLFGLIWPLVCLTVVAARTMFAL